MHQQMPPHNQPGPHWSSAVLFALAAAYDRTVKPLLLTIALMSAFMSAYGLFTQIANPDFAQLLVCFGIGLSLLCISLIFWTGAWLAPSLETRGALAAFVLSVVLGFSAYAMVSVTANLSATGGAMATQIAQETRTNQLENEKTTALGYVDQLVVVRDSISTRASLARQAEIDEIAGRGPTGIGGEGSVSNSFGASSDTYAQAAASLSDVLARARTHADGLDAILTEMRATQNDGELKPTERAARLKILSGRAIGELQSLIALDPARTIRAAASAIKQGVPPRSQARASSQARIAEISAGMRTFARQLEDEADRIAALAPSVPEQVSLSQTEMLIAAAWRMPGLTMAALLLDFCGFVAIGFRISIYAAAKAKQREETEQPYATYVTLDDFWRVEDFVNRAAESKKRIEEAKGTPRRGRPRASDRRTTALPKKSSEKPVARSTKRKGGRTDE